jgi:adenosylcobinamide-GDP ribazoletransferase
VLALLLQVGALAGLLARADWALPVVLAVVTSRLALPLVCSRGVPAARPDGLGSTVAGSVSPLGLLAAVLLAAAAVAVAAAVSAPAGDREPTFAVLAVAAVVVPLLLAGLLALRCVRRLGGVTGDVLGACVEVAFTASLVVLAFG